MEQWDHTENPDGIQLSLSSELLEGKDSAHLDLIDAYQLASEIEYLEHISRSYVVGNEGSGDQIWETLRKIRQILASSNYESSIVPQIDRAQDKIMEDHSTEDEVIQRKTAEQIADLSTTWERIVKEELKRETTIPVADDGIFDAGRLVEEPEAIFSETVWNQLDEMPKQDIVEACRNLAIGSTTSSVMMSLRAVEHCLRQWYEAEKNEELDRAWGAVLDQLMEEFAQDDKKNATLLNQLSDLPPVLSNLYYLKEKRNEVNHPDESPDVDEAQRTLMFVVSTISEIMEEIEPRKDFKPVQIEVSEEYADNEELILDIMKGVERKSPGASAPKDAVFALGQQYGLSYDEVKDAIQDIMMSGKAYEPDTEELRVI